MEKNHQTENWWHIKVVDFHEKKKNCGKRIILSLIKRKVKGNTVTKKKLLSQALALSLSTLEGENRIADLHLRPLWSTE